MCRKKSNNIYDSHESLLQLPTIGERNVTCSNVSHLNVNLIVNAMNNLTGDDLLEGMSLAQYMAMIAAASQQVPPNLPLAVQPRPPGSAHPRPMAPGAHHLHKK